MSVVFWVMLILLILVIVVIILWQKKISIFQKRHKSVITCISLIVSALTIFSVLFAIYTYYDALSIEQSNQKIIIDNMRLEIRSNIEQIAFLENDSVNQMNGKDLLLSRFKYDYMIQSLKFLRNESLRREIMDVVSDMENSNSGMNYYADLEKELITQPDARETFVFIAKPIINYITDYNKNITIQLLAINSSLPK